MKTKIISNALALCFLIGGLFFAYGQIANPHGGAYCVVSSDIKNNTGLCIRTQRGQSFDCIHAPVGNGVKCSGTAGNPTTVNSLRLR